MRAALSAAVVAAAAAASTAAAASAAEPFYTPAMAQAAYEQQRAEAAAAPQPAFPFEAPPIPGAFGMQQAGQPLPSRAMQQEMPRFADAHVHAHAYAAAGHPQQYQYQQQRAGDEGDDGDEDDDGDDEDRSPARPEATPRQRSKLSLPDSPPRFAETHKGKGGLPTVGTLMREAMVETATETEVPAMRTRPLSAAAAHRAARAAGRAAAAKVLNDEDKVLNDATTADDDDKEAAAAPGKEARFAQAKAGGAGDDDSSSASSAAETTTLAAGNNNNDDDAELRKCTSRNSKGECVIKWGRGEMKWGVKTVPAGSLRDTDSGSSDETKVVGESGSSESSDESSDDGSNFVLSKNPAIAEKQKEYRKLHGELAEEHKWVVKVRGVIRSYQNKVLNVQSHITSGKARLGRMRDEINQMIRKAKTDRLQFELKAAVDALQKLQGHSQDLDTRIRDISQSKGALRDTIGRIKLALGRASNEDFTTQERFQELVLSKLPSQHEVKDAMRFAEANHDVKGAMSSLLEVLDRVHRPEAHVTAEDEHERAAVRSLPPLSLVEAGAESESAPRPAAAAAHKHYAVPHLPQPDTDVVGRDVDPAIASEMLDQQFNAVMADTAANSYLD